MKIGIDARFYGPKWGGGGLGRYVLELIQNLQQIDTTNRYVLFLKPENFDSCRLSNRNFAKVKVNAHWYGLKEQLLMPAAIKKAGVELMHFPHWNVPLRSTIPFIVTIHDLILLEDPRSAKATTLGPLRYAVKRLGYRQVLRRAVMSSRAIIAPSQSTKESIWKHFDVPDKKITVIYEGVTELNPKSEIQNSKQIRNPKFEIPKPYFLYVGSAYPHKNLESLLHAFSFFVATYPDVKLVLVGKEDIFYRGLKKEVQEIGIPESAVVFTGYLPDEDLSLIYQGASLYLFPSKIEGFGLPPLEAMRQGVPVAAARSSALPEVLGEAAIYFDPDNIEEMVEIMERGVKESGEWKMEMRAKGIEQAKKYSWGAMAEQTLKVYEQWGK